MSERLEGTVKWFSNERGYGFILQNESTGNGEYFVHYSSLIMEGYKTLKAGQKITFELLQTEKGVQAVNVLVVEE